jgi:hypothetical protein
MPDGHRGEGQAGEHEPWEAWAPEPDDQSDSGRGDASPPPRQMGVSALVACHYGRARGKPLPVDLDDV